MVQLWFNQWRDIFPREALIASVFGEASIVKEERHNGESCLSRFVVVSLTTRSEPYNGKAIHAELANG